MNGEDERNELNASQEPQADRVEPRPAEPPPIAGYCRVCGTGLPESAVRQVSGVIYCPEHNPAASPPGVAPPPPTDSDWARPPSAVTNDVSPGLAFLLGLIPGVGAIYNGQYAKGLVHVVVFGLIISIIESGASGMVPLFSLLLAAWIFYMPFEAFHTAKKRQRGEPVDEFSSLIPLKSQAGSLVGPVILIAGGAFFLLLNLGVIELYQVIRFWPVLLIALGAWLLYSRRSTGTPGER